MYKSISVILLSILSCVALAGPISVNSPSYFLPGYEDQWNQLERIIKDSIHNPVIIYWTGHGGYDYMGEDFSDTVLEARRHGKTIYIKVENYAYSEHAFVLCRIPNVDLGSATIMWHAGTVNGQYAMDSETLQAEKTDLDKCIAKGYMTTADENAILYNHQAVWLKNGHKWITKDVPRH